MKLLVSSLLVCAACSTGSPPAATQGDTSTQPPTAKCQNRDASLTLPAGFCASVFADNAGAGRHAVVAPNGDVFIALSSGGAFVVLRDVNNDGQADSVVQTGGTGGTGIGLYNNFVYLDQGSRIVRYPITAGALRPSGPAQTVVSGLPTNGHNAHNFAIDAQGNLFVNVGSQTNSCQQADRATRSPGVDPCPELNTRAGIWRFNANGSDQQLAAATRYATGLRNSEGLGFAPDGSLWAAVHGRDQLYDNWSSSTFTVAYSAENPGEELVQVNQGDDFGWPYCYYATSDNKLVLAPEYGGDGAKTQRCDTKKTAVAAMPGHWAPMSLLFYTGTAFPAKYRNGVFIAFHGSWNRAPQPQQGFRVVFVPLSGGRQSGAYETFIDGFSPDVNRPTHRPVGLAQGPKGEIYVTDDNGGRVWSVTYAQ